MINIDTDMIIPKQFLKTIKRSGLGKNLFHELRYDLQGNIRNDFVLNWDPYKSASILIAGDNFGCGSSREHAAMSPRYLGCVAVITKSLARIHETNLKKQGVLALTFNEPNDYEKILEDDKISLINLENLEPEKQVTCVITHNNGNKEEITLNHSYNESQIQWFKHGSALNVLRNRK